MENLKERLINFSGNAREKKVYDLAIQLQRMDLGPGYNDWFIQKYMTQGGGVQTGAS